MSVKNDFSCVCSGEFQCLVQRCAGRTESLSEPWRSAEALRTHPPAQQQQLSSPSRHNSAAQSNLPFSIALHLIMAEITLTIKCSNADKATVAIGSTATVLELKEKISESLSVPASQQRLIYKGRVLKDELTLDHYEVQDGHAVHMVKSAGATTTPAASAPSPAASTTTSSSTLPGRPSPPSGAFDPYSMGFGMPPGGLGALGGMPDVNRMQEQLMRNPEVMNQIMNSPMMENLLNNPDLLRNTMLNNPQMQAMLDANPHIRHVLNDPAVCFPISTRAALPPRSPSFYFVRFFVNQWR